MNVIQTEVVFPIAYTVMHYYFISKNLFPNHISYQDIQSTRKKKKTFRKISSNGLRTVMIMKLNFPAFFAWLRTSSRKLAEHTVSNNHF